VNNVTLLTKLISLIKIMHNDKQINATFQGASQYKHLFPRSHCLVAVSVGSDAHEGDRFEATLKLINKNFSRCTILVGDSLQRHNLPLLEMKTSDNDYKHSIYLGDQWIQRNINAITSLTITNTIRRWDEWLKSSYFPQHLKYVKSCYEKNKTLQMAIDASINEFTYRFRKNLNNINLDLIYKASFDYLCEEIAILMLMMPEEKYDYIIYPGKKIDAIEASYELILKRSHKHLMRWVRIHNG
jgi:hypothetical protein